MLFFKKKQEVKEEEQPVALTPEQQLEAVGIDMDIALNYLAGDMEIYKITMQSFVEETPDIRAKMQKCIDEKDMAKFAVYVHGIKSNAKNIGAMPFADIAYEFELKSKADDFGYVSENYASLVEKWDTLINAVNSYLETVQ